MATRRGRSNKFSAGITWKEVRRSLIGVLSWFLRVTWFLDYINPLRIYTRWRRRGCVYDSDGSIVVFKQTLTQRIKDSFVTETSRRRRLLDWVQSLVPAMDINDFSASWTNGVALCALIDALVPGACPELARLKPYHKLNNIRLALKLANKFFALPLNAFRAEEIAIYGSHHQRRVYELLTVIRMLHIRATAPGDGSPSSWAFGRASMRDSGSREGGEGEVTPADPEGPSSSMVYCRNIAKLCRIRKSGYHTGTVGKVYTLDVWFPDGLNPDVIHVDVFPLEEEEVGGFLLEEEISESTVDGLSRISVDLGDSKQTDGGFEQMGESTGQKALRSAKEDSSNASEQHVETSMSIGVSSQRVNKDTESDDLGVKTAGLPVVRSLENGLLRVSFCPTFVGRYQACARFGKADVEGSPMVVSVSPDYGAEPTSDEPSRKRLTFAEAADIIIAKARNSRIYRQLLQNEPTPSAKNSIYDVAAAVLRRTSKVKRTLAFRGHHTQSIINSDRAVVKSRRILKQMITRGGQEIVIDRTSTSVDEPKNQSAAPTSVFLVVPGSSGQSSSSGTVPVSACPSYGVGEDAADGGERNPSDGKPRCHLVVPKLNDALFLVPLSSVVEKPQRGDQFETEGVSLRSLEPDRSGLTSSKPLCITQVSDNQDEVFAVGEDASKDGEIDSSRSTEQSAIQITGDDVIHRPTDELTIRALSERRDQDDGQLCDEQTDHLSSERRLSESDAKSRRNHFKTSSVRESSLARHNQRPGLGVSDDDVFLMGGVLPDDGIENRWKVTTEPLSLDGVVSDRSQADECVDSKGGHFLLPSKHLEGDLENRVEYEEHWPVPSTLIDQLTTDGLISKTLSASGGSRRGSFARQETVQSMEPDVHSVTVELLQQKGNGNNSGKGEEEKESGSRGQVEEEESQPQSTTSKESLINSTPSLPFVLMVESWTQVTYEEIKEATGWKRPVRRVSPRKRTGVAHEAKPIHNDVAEPTRSIDNPGSRGMKVELVSGSPWLDTKSSNWGNNSRSFATHPQPQQQQQHDGSTRQSQAREDEQMRKASPQASATTAAAETESSRRSNSGKHSRSESSRKSDLIQDKTDTERNTLQNPWTVYSMAGTTSGETKRRLSPAGLSIRSLKKDATTRKRRRHSMTQFVEGLRYPRLEGSTNSRRSRRRRRMPFRASIPSLLSHPVSQRRVDSEQQMEGSTAGRRRSSSVDRVGRSGSQCDLRRRSSNGVSDLRKLDDFFAFLDQFSNGQSSQKRQDIMARRFSAESHGSETRSSVYGSVNEFSVREDSVATSQSDFLLTLFGRAAGEERRAKGSSEDRSQSLDGEVWGDAIGGGNSSDEEDDDDVTCFSIYRMCTAFGPGLNEGTVGRLNYFQVRILTKRQGHLTIEMSGHRRHSVLEQNVTYIGDNVYDVTYEVSNPGVYAIAVKWSNCHVQGSPFVCTVSL